MEEKTKKEIGFTENYTNKREQYLNLNINDECIWVTKLRSILNSDIHEKPLGCKISNTHIRIGKVHLDTFYEAQILFSHAHWVQRFANELSHKITDSIQQKKRIVLVGYETYIEPVMYLLKEVIKKKYRELDVEYCIFEEEKYTYLQNVKAPEIRYIETAFKKGDTEDILKATQIVFICGISTTLSTYGRMLDQVKTDLSNKIYNDEIADKDEKRLKALFNKNVESKDKNTAQNAIQYFSIIQVLPNKLESNKCEFVISDKDDYKEILTWDDSEKWVNRRTKVKTVETTINVPYIVDVKCGWHIASDCKMCYPNDVLKEKPIIQTSETSVVPIQRILLNKKNKDNDAPDTIKVNAIDFFKKDDKGNFLFRDYLYYGHTVRGEHHFLYYIRTNHLFADIISDNIPKCVDASGKENFNALKKFKDYCKQAKKNIEERLSENKCGVDDAIHIIISPSHFSSKMFCNAINQYVFKYKAHVISFDPQKEYRSSFETKFSNYAYFLEQTKEMLEDSGDSKKKLFFYFVDDQIITGSNFYRMTSLIKNLFAQPESIKIWNGVFVIVSRNSNSTKMDYVDDISAYYPLFNISVPSVRSYADSCPMCKMREDAENYVKKSVLDCNARHWMEKVSWNKLNTLEQAKEKIMPQKGDLEKEKLKKENLKDRRFRRFYCENELQKVLSGKGNGENIHDILVERIADILAKNKGENKWDGEGEQCEYLISCVKALSRPFIYYREDVKPIALNIIIGLTEGLLENKDLLSGGYKWGDQEIPLYRKQISVTFNDKYEVYILLKILINCLASIDSTYLLHYNSDGKTIMEVCKIAELYSFVQNVLGDDDAKKVLTFSPTDTSGEEKHSFYMVLLNAVKRIILGISGDSKSEKLKSILEYAEDNSVVKSFVKNRGKNSIYDFSLVQAIFLENSVNNLGFKNDIKKEANLTKKYNEIIQNLKNTDKEESVKMQFLYYDEQMQENGGFDVFIIDENAQRKSIAAFLTEEDEKTAININDIKNELLSFGFYNQYGKFLIKLHGYIEEDIEFDKEKKEKPKKEVLLLVDFGDKVLNIKDQLKCIRRILQYRDSLAGIARKDIDSGAIKSAIQAKTFNRYLNTNKLSGHGADKDLQKLAELVYYRLQDDKPNERKQGYELLNILMNQCISLGAGREILSEYFDPSEIKSYDPFSIGLGFYEPKGKSSFIKNYLNDIQIEEFATKLFGDGNYNIKSTINIIDVEGSDSEWSLKKYPKLFSKDEEEKDDSSYQIFLIGLIDIFIRNAIKHGDRQGLTIDVSIEGTDSQYTVKIENKISRSGKEFKGTSTLLSAPKNRKILNDQKRFSKNSSSDIGGFTELYLHNFLHRKENSNSGGDYYRVNMVRQGDKFVATIKVIEKGEKNEKNFIN